MTDDNKQPAGSISTDARASLSFNVPLGQPVSPNPKDNIFLVGTAHVSEKSIREVEEAIERYAPDVVAVELDERRFKALQQPEDARMFAGSAWVVWLIVGAAGLACATGFLYLRKLVPPEKNVAALAE